jgi:hypothetical protein
VYQWNKEVDQGIVQQIAILAYNRWPRLRESRDMKNAARQLCPTSYSIVSTPQDRFLSPPGTFTLAPELVWNIVKCLKKLWEICKKQLPNRNDLRKSYYQTARGWVLVKLFSHMRNTICRHRARKRLPTPNRQKTPPDLCMKRLCRYRQRASVRSRTVRRFRPRPQDAEICRVRHWPEDTDHRIFIHLIEIGAATNLRTPFCTQNKNVHGHHRLLVCVFPSAILVGRWPNSIERNI